MKNKDILLDVIGDTDEKLVPELTAKKKKSSIIKWTALGGVCAAAVIACIAILPKTGDDTVISPSDKVGSNAMLLAAAAYPEMPMYPDEMDQDALTQWNDAKQALRDQPAGYKDGFDTFFSDTANTFLTGAESENIVYSPLSLYMALGMSAEITDGSSRQQILDVLGQGDIDTLRSHSRSIWLANYMDDGMAKCILANSLWTNSNADYKQDTVDTRLGSRLFERQFLLVCLIDDSQLCHIVFLLPLDGRVDSRTHLVGNLQGLGCASCLTVCQIAWTEIPTDDIEAMAQTVRIHKGIVNLLIEVSTFAIASC